MGSMGKDPGGVLGAKPPEAPGFYSIFSAKYCLSLSDMLTHSSLKEIRHTRHVFETYFETSIGYENI